jgi:hypothetical protein
VAVIALWCAAAMAQGFVSVGTGIKPLGLPGIQTLTGGGARIGYDAGVVAPFFGVELVGASVHPSDDEIALSGSSLSAQLGVKIEADRGDRPAYPFLAAGAILSRQRGAIEDVDNELISTIGWDNLPGAFGGAGGEAEITRRVGIGLEVGMAALLGKYVESEHSPSGRLPSDYHADYKLHTLFSYGDLHLTFRLGRQP